MPSFDPIIRQLSRPFTPEAVKVKIQTANAKGALVVSYIDARHVAERLNLVIPGGWNDSYRVIEDSKGKIVAVECQLSVIIDGQTLFRTDVGTHDIYGGRNVPEDQINNQMGGLKILYSDAFKRAAVKFGIGSFLYALPSSFLTPDHLTGTSPKYKIPQKSRDLLNKKYKKWLDTQGIKIFGEPLDHGDAENAQGDVEIDKAEDEE